MQGTGTTTDPYLITSWEELQSIINDLDKCYKLMNDLSKDTVGYDIYASNIANEGGGWSPIGKHYEEFTGDFDGNNHTISDLYINTDDRYIPIGMFGAIFEGNIKNVGILDYNILGDINDVGGLVGKSSNSTITNCYSAGKVSGSDYIGGLIGVGNNSTITNCYSTGEISGSDYIGGLIGSNDSSIVINCYSAGKVSGSYYIGGLVGSSDSSIVTNCYSIGEISGSVVGGLVGSSGGNTTITNCYSTGEVSGSDVTGGLIGVGDNSTTTNCYSIGKVSGSDDVGGLVGLNYTSSFLNSFWDIDTSNQTSSAGGKGRTTTQLKSLSNYSYWDIITINSVDEKDTSHAWNIVDGSTYPFFSGGVINQTISSVPTQNKAFRNIKVIRDGKEEPVTHIQMKKNNRLRNVIEVRLIKNGDIISTWKKEDINPGIVTDGLQLSYDPAGLSNDTLGNTITDLSGNNNNGTLHGFANTVSSGISEDNYFVLDGVDDYIEFPTLDCFNNSNSFSINIIFNYTGANMGYLVSLNKQIDTYLGVGINYTTKILDVRTKYNGQMISAHLLDTQISNNIWYDLTMVFDNTVGFKFYLDGILVYEMDNNPVSLDVYEWGANTIGNNKNSSYWQGLVNKFMIYDRPLTPEEVLQNYNANK